MKEIKQAGPIRCLFCLEVAIIYRARITIEYGPPMNPANRLKASGLPLFFKIANPGEVEIDGPEDRLREYRA